MDQWKFGTVIQNRIAQIMLVGQSDGTCKTTDHFKQLVPDGCWFGVMLFDFLERSGGEGPYGLFGDVTWVLNGDDWEIVDD